MTKKIKDFLLIFKLLLIPKLFPTPFCNLRLYFPLISLMAWMMSNLEIYEKKPE